MQNDDLLGCILARVRIIMLVASEEERYCERICSYYQTGLEGFSDDVVIWNGRKFVHAVRNGNIAPGGRNENIMFTDYASQFFGNPGSGRFVLSMLSGSGGNEYKLKDADSRVVFVLNDFNVYMNDPVTKRMLKNFASDEQEKPYSIIITTALDGVSGELEDSVAFCGGPLPGLDELRSYLEEHIGEAKNLPGIIVQEKLLDRRRLASAAYGLSKNSAEMSFRASLISLGGVTIDSADNIILHKKQLFRDSECLEYYPPASGECGFGGYGRLQDEIKRRSASFGEAGQNYGLTDPKKAILLIGPPGCGKSFFIKEMAGRVFSIPLLRLNMAAVFGSEIGSSEKKFINALKQVERIAHAILWIDEIEKIITCGDASCDGGASQRLYGSFLTWLQEQRGVIVLATANDLDSMSVEMIRRFDVFIMGLPNAVEREEIVPILLHRHGIPAELFETCEFEEIVAGTEGFTAADIEGMIIDSRFAQLSQPEKSVFEVMRNEMKNRIPFSKMYPEEAEKYIEMNKKKDFFNASY